MCRLTKHSIVLTTESARLLGEEGRLELLGFSTVLAVRKSELEVFMSVHDVLVSLKIFVSNNVKVTEDGKHNCMVRTKRAIAYAEQLSKVHAYRPELRFADALKGLHLYGAKVIYPAELVNLSVSAA